MVGDETRKRGRVIRSMIETEKAFNTKRCGCVRNDLTINFKRTNNSGQAESDGKEL